MNASTEKTSHLTEQMNDEESMVVNAMVADLTGNQSPVRGPNPTAANDMHIHEIGANAVHAHLADDNATQEPVDDEDAGPSSLGGLDVNQRFGARASAALRQVIAERLNFSRALAGLNQTEMSLALGFKNPTQINLWERAQRTPPLHALLAVADVLGVSLDFLVGVSDEPDRDAQLARRTALVGAMRRMLEGHASAVADVILSGEFDPSNTIRAHSLCSKTEDLARAVEQFRARNEKVFDGLPAGALLLRMAKEAAEAANAVASLLDEADTHRYRTLEVARRVVF